MAKKTILVPIDGSKPSIRALEYLARRKDNGEDFDVALLTVTQYESLREAAKKATSGKQQPATGKQVFSIPAVKKLAADLNATPTVQWDDDPAVAIMAARKKTNSEEIVMGTRGLGRLKGLLMGSIATKVVQLADVPVTLVK